MAVIEAKNPSSMRIKLFVEMVDGKARTKSKTYSNVKNTASAQDMYDVASALMALQDLDVLEVIKQDYTILEG